MASVALPLRGGDKAGRKGTQSSGVAIQDAGLRVSRPVSGAVGFYSFRSITQDVN